MQFEPGRAAIQVAVRTRALLVHFPARGYAELRDQIVRSAESIGNNIAEGRGSAFQAEYARFLDTAARSANELNSQLRTAVEYEIVPKREAFALIGTVICTRKMVDSLREVVQSKLRAEETRKRAARSRKRSSSRKPKRSSELSDDQP